MKLQSPVISSQITLFMWLNSGDQELTDISMTPSFHVHKYLEIFLFFFFPLSSPPKRTYPSKLYPWIKKLETIPSSVHASLLGGQFKCYRASNSQDTSNIIVVYI